MIPLLGRCVLYDARMLSATCYSTVQATATVIQQDIIIMKSEKWCRSPSFWSDVLFFFSKFCGEFF